MFEAAGRPLMNTSMVTDEGWMLGEADADDDDGGGMVVSTDKVNVCP